MSPAIRPRWRATFGRLCGGTDGAETPRADRSPYRVATVQSYDLFPQTAHVETVVLLEG